MGSILLLALEVLGVIRSHQVARYLSCTANVTHPASYMEWYWKLGPSVMHGTGKAMAYILLLEFTIAQSPDKMKGLAIGIMVACQGFLFMIHVNVMQFSFTLCSDLAALIAFVVLVAIFLVLSKSYTLRERNRVMVLDILGPSVMHGTGKAMAYILLLEIYNCSVTRQNERSCNWNTW